MDINCFWILETMKLNILLISQNRTDCFYFIFFFQLSKFDYNRNRLWGIDKRFLFQSDSISSPHTTFIECTPRKNNSLIIMFFFSTTKKKLIISATAAWCFLLSKKYKCWFLISNFPSVKMCVNARKHKLQNMWGLPSNILQFSLVCVFITREK